MILVTMCEISLSKPILLKTIMKHHFIFGKHLIRLISPELNRRVKMC